jgi:hypothetical protein
MILFCLNFNCRGQASDSLSLADTAPRKYYLILGKPGHLKKARFFAGDQITFKLVKDKKFYAGSIAEIRPNSLVFWGAEIPLSEIDQIRVEKRSGLQKAAMALSTVFQKAGGLFMLVGAGNFLLLPDNRQDGLVTMGGAACIYATGRALRVFRKRAYKVNRRYPLRTVEII